MSNPILKPVEFNQDFVRVLYGHINDMTGEIEQLRERIDDLEAVGKLYAAKLAKS